MRKAKNKKEKTKERNSRERKTRDRNVRNSETVSFEKLDQILTCWVGILQKIFVHIKRNVFYVK